MQPNNCCPPNTPVSIPGSTGVNGYTTITANFLVPAAGANVTVSVGNSLLLPVGLKVVFAGTAHFQVASIVSPTSVVLTFLNYTGDVAAGTTINSGSVVAPSDGAIGLSAFTTTTANVTLPAQNANVAVSIVNGQWMKAGQKVFVSDGTNWGTFQVVTVPTSAPFTTATLQFLQVTGDAVPTTVIASGATVTPIGVQGAAGTNGFTVAGSISATTAQTQQLTTTPAQAMSLTLTLAASAGKTYLLFARCRLDYVGATFAANRTVTFKIRRTNNTAGDVTNGITTFQTAVITTLSYTAGNLVVVAIPYTTAGTSDIIQPFVSIDVLPSAGSIQVIEGNITAVELT